VAFKCFLKIATDDNIEKITHELHSRNWFVRYAAAKTLSKMGEEGIRKLLNCRGHDACELALAESGNTETKVEANDIN
jgi:HEAT repeat protein